MADIKEDDGERLGPIPLPGNGCGKLEGVERDKILKKTNCNAVVRQRPQWGAGRKLVVTGGTKEQRQQAKKMAFHYILANQIIDVGPRRDGEAPYVHHMGISYFPFPRLSNLQNC